MLRSLVGSEMCIRDRHQVDPAAGQQEIGIAEHVGAEEIVPAYTGEERANCLLYTSDAADDLLCVDLGGRRIIKKKQTQAHRRCNQFTVVIIIQNTERFYTRRISTHPIHTCTYN